MYFYLTFFVHPVLNALDHYWTDWTYPNKAVIVIKKQDIDTLGQSHDLCRESARLLREIDACKIDEKAKKYRISINEDLKKARRKMVLLKKHIDNRARLIAEKELKKKVRQNEKPI